MELIYFWIRKYKNIEEKGFPLSSKWITDCSIENRQENGTIDLKINTVKRENHLQLFEQPIDDAKIIIGENGSGKSNVLFCLINFLMNRDNTDMDALLVTSTHVLMRGRLNLTSALPIVNGKPLSMINNLNIYIFHKPYLLEKSDEIDSVDRIGPSLMETYLSESHLLFYSNVMNQDNMYSSEGVASSYRVWENQGLNYFDLSTESMMISDFERNSSGAEHLVSGVSEMLSYKSGESLRWLNFLAVHKKYEIGYEFRIPGINVQFNDSNQKLWKSVDFIFSKHDSANSLIIHNKLEKQFQSLERNNKEAEFFYELYKNVLYTILEFKLNYNANSQTRHEYPVIGLLSNFEKFYDQKLDLKLALLTYLKKDKNGPALYALVKNTLEIFERYFTDAFQSGKLICRGMHGFYIPSKNCVQVAGEFSKPPFIGMNLRRKNYAPEFIKFNFFDFDFHSLSSGERTFLSIFSRLNAIKRHIKQKKQVYVLIDEGEIGFHPQWQKEYFYILVDFLGRFFKKNKVQLIITSHSPFLASDLPKQNIIFLEKKEGLTTISDLNSKENTFGANIHTLFTDAFFLKGALMGDFAKQNIDRLINYLTKANPDKKQRNNFRIMLEAIGEPVVQYKLQTLWNSKFGKEEEILSLNKRLNELKSQ